MEKNNEKMSRPYLAPETEIVKIGGEIPVMQTIGPGSKEEGGSFGG